MLGAEGDGWKVAITTLMNERISLSGAGSIGGDAVGGSPVSRLVDKHRGSTDPLVRQQLAEAYIESTLIRLNYQRAADKRTSGAEAGPEGSSGVAWEGQNLSKTVRSGRAPEIQADATTAFGFLRAQANTIEGGTSDIMRNILGERVLGLPKEPDNSRELPWSEVPRSG
jgi:alkylation response protein AidB-like acyl-CoA dehydrogenase